MNWITKYYKKNILIDEIDINNRTESEAENETIANMPVDWTLINKELID